MNFNALHWSPLPDFRSHLLLKKKKKNTKKKSTKEFSDLQTAGAWVDISRVRACVWGWRCYRIGLGWGADVKRLCCCSGRKYNTNNNNYNR